jgi:hypothetical protein
VITSGTPTPSAPVTFNSSVTNSESDQCSLPGGRCHDRP